MYTHTCDRQTDRQTDRLLGGDVEEVDAGVVALGELMYTHTRVTDRQTDRQTDCSEAMSRR